MLAYCAESSHFSDPLCRRAHLPAQTHSRAPLHTGERSRSTFQSFLPTALPLIGLTLTIEGGPAQHIERRRKWPLSQLGIFDRRLQYMASCLQLNTHSYSTSLSVCFVPSFQETLREFVYSNTFRVALSYYFCTFGAQYTKVT